MKGQDIKLEKPTEKHVQQDSNLTPARHAEREAIKQGSVIKSSEGQTKPSLIHEIVWYFSLKGGSSSLSVQLLSKATTYYLGICSPPDGQRIWDITPATPLLQSQHGA